MKVRIVGDGQLESDVQEYLTVGKIYDAERHPVIKKDLGMLKADDGLTITVNLDHSHLCGHISDATGDLRWEVVDE